MKEKFSTIKALEKDIADANADARIAESQARLHRTDGGEIPESSKEYVQQTEREEIQRNREANERMFNQFLGADDDEYQTGGELIGGVMDDVLGTSSSTDQKTVTKKTSTKVKKKSTKKKSAAVTENATVAAQDAQQGTIEPQHEETHADTKINADSDKPEKIDSAAEPNKAAETSPVNETVKTATVDASDGKTVTSEDSGSGTSPVADADKKNNVGKSRQQDQLKKNDTVAKSSTAEPKAQDGKPTPTDVRDPKLPAESFDAEYLRLIKLDLAEAQKHRHEMPVEAKRGLSDETIDHFNFGYLPQWILTKARAEFNCGIYVDKETGETKQLPPPSERIIVPTRSSNHFNAIATPAARQNMHRNFWKQHAGEMELFCDDVALNADLIVLVEGEMDVASIWQATKGKIAAVAVLGCGNWKKTLLPRLPELRGKIFVIMFDSDQSGRQNARRLHDELMKRGYPAISRPLYEAMSNYEKRRLTQFADANDILQKEGEDFLNELIQARIIAGAKTDIQIAVATAAHNAEQYAKQEAERAARQDRKPVNLEFSGDVDRDQITLILKDFVHAKDLPRNQWWSVGAILHRYGFSRDEFKTWSDDGDDRFDADECDRVWDYFEERAEDLKDDEGYHVGTLINLAKENGYIPPRRATKLPIDLKCPDNVTFSRNSIIVEGGTEKNPKSIVAARTIILPTRKFVTDGEGGVRYEVAIMTPSGKLKRAVVPKRTLLDPSRIYELCDHDAIVGNPKFLATFFAELLALRENDELIKTTTVFTQTGWTDETFSEFIYPSPDADYIVQRTGFDFDTSLGTRGDAELWKKTFVEAMNYGGAVARVYCGFALAAPLVRPFNLPNLQCHLHAESGSGKTALEKLASSIFGNPKELIRTFEASPKNRQAVAAAYRDLPTFLDELGTLSGKKAAEALSQSVYAYSIGNQNQIQTRAGDSRPLVKFYGARLSTGEFAILRQHDPRGSFKRLPQLSCENLLPDEFAAALHVISENNFGHFARPWINFIIEHRADICRNYQLYAAACTQGNIYEATLVKSLVAAAVAAQFFMVCIGHQPAFDDAIITADVKQVLQGMPTIKEMSEDTRAIAALQSFIGAHPRNFITEYKDKDDGKIKESAAWTTPTFGKRFMNGEVAFLPTELEKILEKELGFSSCEAIVTALNNADKLIVNPGRTRHIVRLDGEPKRTIHFAAGVLSNGYTKTSSDSDEIYLPPK